MRRAIEIHLNNLCLCDLILQG